jgi:hypothetical protein
MNNLNGVIARMQVVNEQQIHSSLGFSPPRPSERQQQIWSSFVQYASRLGVRPFPASPAAAASWLDSLPEAEIEPALEALQVTHDAVGASSPVGCSLAVKTVLERRLRTECPRSWTKEDRQFFISLPREVQAILTRRENERDASLRTRQNKLAAEMKRLAEAEPKKEVGNE